MKHKLFEYLTQVHKNKQNTEKSDVDQLNEATKRFNAINNTNFQFNELIVEYMTYIESNHVGNAIH